MYLYLLYINMYIMLQYGFRLFGVSELFEMNFGLFVCLWQVVVSCGLAWVVFAIVVYGDWLDAVRLVVGGLLGFSVICCCNG